MSGIPRAGTDHSAPAVDTEDIPRAFLASRLPQAAGDELARRLEFVRRRGRTGCCRWIPRERWHLTLRFFGTLPAAQLGALDAALTPLAATSAAIGCSWASTLALPSWRQPGVVAFAVASGGMLEALAQRVDAALADAFGAPDKPFLAHVSVMRLRLPSAREIAQTRAAFAQIDVADWPHFELSAIALYRSDLPPDGPRYTALREYPFGGEPRRLAE